MKARLEARRRACAPDVNSFLPLSYFPLLCSALLCPALSVHLHLSLSIAPSIAACLTKAEPEQPTTGTA